MTVRRPGPHTESEPPVGVRSEMGAWPDPPPRSLVVRGLHRLARELVAPVVGLMALGHRFGRVLLRTEHVLTGGCDRRGKCCEHVLVEWLPLYERYPLLGRLALWRLTRFYRFFDRGYVWEVQDGLLVRVLGCHALRADGRCGEYRLRPLLCRTYPEVPLRGRPQFLPGCGYGSRPRFGSPADATSSLVQIGAGRSGRPPPPDETTSERGPPTA